MASSSSWAIFSANNQNWQSVTTICSQIKRCYQEAFSHIHLIEYNYEDHSSHFEVLKIAKDLIERKIEKLIFVDHSPPPFILLKLLYQLQSNYRPEVVIHIYGNFFHRFDYYFREQEYLKLYPTRLTAASTAHQQLLLSSCLKDQDIHLFPFPITPKDWLFSEDKRNHFRKKFNLSLEDNVFIFQGRKSMQKNILLLLDLFEKILIEAPNSHLLVLGDYDESSPNYLGHYFCRQHGFFYQCYQEKKKSLKTSTQERIIELTHCPPSEVHEALCASDIFLSLGLHHYEDFGLAPLEALSSGLSCILSEWGGHLDFLKNFPLAYGIPVQLTHRGIIINKDEIISILNKTLHQPQSPQVRIEQNLISEKHYSVFSLSKTLKEIHQSPFVPFKGFLPEFLNFQRRKIDNTTNSLYHKHINNFMLKDSPHGGKTK